MQRLATRGTLLAALAFAAGACSSVSTQQEVQLGQQAAAQVDQQLPIVQDAAIDQYLNTLGNQLAGVTSRSDLQWHFALVNTDVVNAFALPGGFVYINRGIVSRADRMDELAGVMAHEIGHVVLRHSVKQMQQTQEAQVGVTLACVLTGACQSQAAQAAINVGGSLVFAKFSRQDETQADEQGFKELVAARIDPRGMVSFFQKLLAEEQASGGAPSGLQAWFTDHPLTQDRIADIQRLVSTVPESQLNQMTADTQAFQAFKQRVAALPAPPPTQGQ